ncbi:tRNA uridine-5-carboxymethylaminomethyl(34) synthesis GTPase MnmE [Marinicauda algicola]|uniref:tRNA modification GTPase MnmE n=2 Tax=Marinicauda algicola TaxID=2029849 RepID=A0A4S2H0E4_9PROT|nr:tRNA uridine-5-carboxymethylaminomethyl(34) synthesis GTPase MnmE [Marinicauda algicola]TGY89010.1 tRNA uridine-5-carboxymethylaminomethyl(34) synthesis GTPase MnmE [Marinicauda algicola]
MTDTIFALASAPGRAGVAVLRVSGPRAAAILGSLAGGLPEPRRAALRALRGADGGVIDRGLVLWFPGPASFTGEDCAEFHVHGGPAVIAAMADALSVAGARPAEAGEFTRRAFEHGKLDLTEAEGLADLVDAETEGQRAQALAQLDGALKSLYEGWREELIAILAAVEGEIDFPDEADVPEALSHTAAAPLESLIAALEDHLADDRRGERVREGFVIALIGPPNAGKSSLLNALARREAAIVTEIPGTTRDIVEVRQVRAGFPVILADTAGLREAADIVEAEGVRRALARAQDADLRLGVLDVSRETSHERAALLARLRPGDALVLNKTDLAAPPQIDVPEGVRVIALSVKAAEGLDALEAFLDETVLDRLGRREAPALSRARHRRAVEEALAALERAREQLGRHPELAGADLHLAVRALESLTGRIDVEDVLDRVFSQFCIGK